MQAFIFPYKQASGSAKLLGKGLGAKIIRLKGSKFKAGNNKIIINWGSSALPDEYLECKVLNTPDKVAMVANKLHYFNAAEQYNKDNQEMPLRVPGFTTDKEVAKGWGATIVAREKLTGHSGEGIVLYEPDEDVGDAPLYVRYIPKKYEYRIHVLNDKVVDVQRKARTSDVPDDRVNWKVRNHGNGFIFARNEGGEIPQDVLDQSILAVKVAGLDFGAVDVIYNEKHGKAYVLEINTAPGLAGTTLDNYINNFKKIIKG